MRIGQGFDVHRLTQGRVLVLGSVEIPDTRGLAGHSDAANDGLNLVAITTGVGKPFQDHNADAFARHLAGSGVIEGAFWIGGLRQQAGPRHRFVRGQPHCPVPCGAEHHVAVAGAENVDGS